MSAKYPRTPHLPWSPGATKDDRKHGSGQIPDLPGRSFEEIREYLRENAMEGLVFHHPDGRMAKIRRPDFGLLWPLKD